MIVYVENILKSAEKLLELMRELRRIAGDKVNIK